MVVELVGDDGDESVGGLGVVLVGFETVALVDVGVGGGVSPREVVGGNVVPGGMYVPGGIGVPGASTSGFWPEPGAGRIVTTGVPSGPTVTTAVGEVDGSGCATPLTVIVPGTALPGISCGPDEELALPALMSPPAFVDGDASSAMPPNAVARTTPLAASST